MSKPQEVTDADFEQEVLKSDLPVVVDFWAEWCGPCHQIAPILESLADEYDGKIKFVKVDTEENFETLSSYGVLSLPTLLLFKEGQPIERITGARPKGDLMRYLDKALA
ncbi:MAG: thioredoxin [Chloroflexi bacterium]|nr:thioredoxin [Chloroflexota bacterium]MCH8349719.1 thioredoxin [Chloroflexota bacterium]MCI0781306.1 thioredoxin [Chloroflexota bacterium]MCI0785343.1 thioredoxin [Chloroflexota bacterium]MCI0793087.1 thioredoxin [Chloroflexota bacterium]